MLVVACLAMGRPAAAQQSAAATEPAQTDVREWIQRKWKGEPPPQAVAFARELARRNLPVSDLARAYRVAQRALWHWGTSEIQQRITELALEAVGHYGAPYFRGFGEGDNEHPIGPDYAHRTAPSYFNMRKTTIYGGSNEIQHNIIAKMVLGL